MLFKYGNVATGKFFYDRTKAQKEVKKFILNSQSFMIKAPRRYGKTSLIKQSFNTLDIDYFYIDFRRISRLELFNDNLMEYLYSKMGIKGALKQLQENIMKFFNHNKVNLKVNLEIFEASVELFSNKTLSQEDRMAKLLDLIQEIAQELNEKIYIVMDEFQDVKNLDSKSSNILELMRAIMQHHSDVCYVFAGSNMTIMTELFENQKSAFFNFCRKYKLEAFNTNELETEIIEAFKSKQIVFKTDDILSRLLLKTKGHPANTMLVMQILESICLDLDIKMIDKSIADEAYISAYDELHDLLNEYVRDIKSKEHLHDVIYRIAKDEPQILESSSLRQKRVTLVTMGYLEKMNRGNYRIIDGFLEDFLKEK